MRRFCNKMHAHSQALAPVAGALGLLFVVLLTLTLSRSRSLAEPAADLVVEKTVNTTQAAPGDTLTYTIHITNNEVSDFSLLMTDTLPPEVDYVTDTLQVIGSGIATITDDVLTWAYDSFGWHQEVVVIFSAEISSVIGSATVTNTAEVTGTGELLASNVVTTEVSPGQLEVLKTVNPSSVRPDEQVAYAIYINNTGLGAVDPFSVADSLPPEVGYAGSLDADGGTGVSCGEAGDTITCTGRLDPAEGVTITFAADVSSTLSEGTVFTNTVSVAGAGLPVSDSVAASVKTDMEYFLPIVFKNYPPVLTLTVSAPFNGVYTASWMIVSPPVEYVLQEATSSNFGCNLQTYTTTEPYMVFDKGSASQTWYYRVRADGPWGQGPAWSNIASSSNGFYDDFSCSASGWPEQKVFVYYSQSEGVNKYWRRGYVENNYYRIYIDSGGPMMWFIQPTTYAPYRPSTDKFCIEARVKFYHWGYWDNAGLIFGASESGTEFYALGMGYANKQMSWGLLYKKNYEFPKKAFFGNTTYAGGDIDPDLVYNDWNTLKVSVDGNQVLSLYINGKSKLTGPVTMPGLSAMTRVGFVAGVYEITPMDWRVDYFRVIENAECTP